MRINGDLEFIAAGSGVLKNTVIESFASDPGTGVVAGRIYYNTTNNEYRFYDGTSWQVFGTGGTAGGIQTELDDTQSSLGSFINTDGSFNEVPLNSLGNVTGLTGSDSLLDALSQLDAAITAAAGVDTLAELTDVTLAGLANKDVLAYDGAGWVNRTRDGNDLVTKETTQTISGAKTFSAGTTFTSTINADAGAEATPSLFFEGDSDTGFYQSAGNEVSISAAGARIATFSDSTFTGLDVDGNIQSSGQFLADNGTTGFPGYSFTSDDTTGMFVGSGGGEEANIGISYAGSLVFGWDAFNGFLVHDDSTGNGAITATTYASNVDTAGLDYAIPNKKYVDDAIAASAVAALNDIGDVVAPSPADGHFLVHNGTNWVNEAPATARTSLDVYSTTQADTNFVDVAGDTMTGDLTMSGANLVADSGAAATPSVTFSGDTDTGLSAAVANTLVLSAGGTGIVTVGTGSVTLTQELLAPAGTAGAPAVSFSGDTDTGMYSGGVNILAFTAGGQESLNIEADGTLNVAAVTDYETLVLDDDDIPNKKYVDDEIAGGLGSTNLGDLNDVDVIGVADNSILVYNSSTTNWEDETPATARTTLGLVSGGAGDIWVEKSGDAMTGNLDMGTNKVINLSDPTNGQDAATKTYVDNVASGLNARPAVDVLSDSNGIDSVGGTWTYAGTPGTDEEIGATLTRDANGAVGTVDGQTVSSAGANRILVTGRTNALENGLYVLTQDGDGSNPTVLTRCGTCDETSEVPSAFVFVQTGTLYGDTGWVASVDDLSTFEIGVDDINWVQFSGSGTIQAGTGLNLTGTTLDVNLGAGIVELPTDEVGIDLYDAATGALILTNDGSTRGTATGDQLYLLLDSNGSLTQGAGGLSVAASTFTGDTGSDATILPGEAMNFIGGTGVSTTVAASGSDVDVTFDVAVATEAASQGAGTLGIAEFADGDFVVTSGFVELDPVGVQESISLTFSPETGTDVTLTGATDTLNIDSNTLTVSGAGTTITIDLNAVLSDLNDVNFFVGGGGGEIEISTATSTRNRLYPYGQGLIAYTGTYSNGNNNAYIFSGYAPAYGGFNRGAQVLAWNPSDTNGTADGTWVTAWSDSLMQASGMGAFYEWQANSTFTTDGYTGFAQHAGDAWSATEGATAVFARWDTTANAWRNFTPSQMVTMLNATGGLTGVSAQFTVAGDSGTDQVITVAASGSDDTLTVAGGTGIDTAMTADTVTISLNASVNDLSDVTVSSAAGGEVLVYSAGNSDFRNRPIHYVESSASATSHSISHNLGQQYVNVTVVDASDQVIIPQSITMTDANTVTVTLSSAAAVTVIVTGVNAS
jgi:hypothetical protein